MHSPPSTDNSASLRFSGVPGTARLSSIREVGAAFDAGLSPVALVEECLERIARHDGAINAMVAVDEAGAVAAARLAETELRSGRRRGPLHGVPVAIKDLIDVAGCRTTAASRLFDGRIAERDATAIRNLQAAGAIIVGKTNMHELATGGHDNPWYGKVVHPRDPRRGTGGSSSGSAAAVAAGFCVAAVGTDTGGSLRSPAAATGLVGFKPSQGLIDTSGTLPTARSLDVLGPLTSTVADARLLTEALSGRRAVAGSVRGPAGLVVATCPDLHGGHKVDPLVAQSHALWFDRLQHAGVRVMELRFDRAGALREAGLAILKYEFAEHFGAAIRAQPHRVGAPTRAFAEAASSVSRASYTDALDVREDCRRRFRSLMEGVDVLALPVAPGLAPRLDDDLTSNGEAMVSYSGAGAVFRLWANCLAMPSIAVPLACDGPLPASIQLAARSGEDWALLDRAEVLVAVQP